MPDPAAAMPAHCNAREQRLRLKVSMLVLSVLASTESCAVVPSHTPSTEGKIGLQSIEQTAWGEVDGKPVTLFTLTNKNGLRAKVASYGGIITELHVPDREGKLADIVLGFDDVASYVKGSPYFGAVIG